MIRLHKMLLWGEEAGKRKRGIRRQLKRGEAPDFLFIVFLSGPEAKSLLEIVPAREAFRRMILYREKEAVGLAVGKAEALEVVRRLIDGVYRKTGAFDLQAWFGEDKTLVKAVPETEEAVRK